MQNRFQNFSPGGGGKDNPLVVVLIVLAVILFIVGLVAAVFLFVSAILRKMREYTKLQQIQILSYEYVVEDLADIFALSNASAPPLQDSEEASNQATSVKSTGPAPSAPPEVTQMPPHQEVMTTTSKSGKSTSTVGGQASKNTPAPENQATRLYPDIPPMNPEVNRQLKKEFNQLVDLSMDHI